LLSRIWLGSIGWKPRKYDAPPALNMSPKFDEVPIITHLIVLAKICRPRTLSSPMTRRKFETVSDLLVLGLFAPDRGRQLWRRGRLAHEPLEVPASAAVSTSARRSYRLADLT